MKITQRLDKSRFVAIKNDTQNNISKKDSQEACFNRNHLSIYTSMISKTRLLAGLMTMSQFAQAVNQFTSYSKEEVKNILTSRKKISSVQSITPEQILQYLEDQESGLQYQGSRVDTYSLSEVSGEYLKGAIKHAISDITEDEALLMAVDLIEVMKTKNISRTKNICKAIESIHRVKNDASIQATVFQSTSSEFWQRDGKNFKNIVIQAPTQTKKIETQQEVAAILANVKPEEDGEPKDVSLDDFEGEIEENAAIDQRFENETSEKIEDEVNVQEEKNTLKESFVPESDVTETSEDTTQSDPGLYQEHHVNTSKEDKNPELNALEKKFKEAFKEEVEYIEFQPDDKQD